MGSWLPSSPRASSSDSVATRRHPRRSGRGHRRSRHGDRLAARHRPRDRRHHIDCHHALAVDGPAADRSPALADGPGGDRASTGLRGHPAAGPDGARRDPARHPAARGRPRTAYGKPRRPDVRRRHDGRDVVQPAQRAGEVLRERAHPRPARAGADPGDVLPHRQMGRALPGSHPAARRQPPLRVGQPHLRPRGVHGRLLQPAAGAEHPDDRGRGEDVQRRRAVRRPADPLLPLPRPLPRRRGAGRARTAGADRDRRRRGERRSVRDRLAADRAGGALAGQAGLGGHHARDRGERRDDG